MRLKYVFWKEVIVEAFLHSVSVGWCDLFLLRQCSKMGFYVVSLPHCVMSMRILVTKRKYENISLRLVCLSLFVFSWDKNRLYLNEPLFCHFPTESPQQLGLLSYRVISLCKYEAEWKSKVNLLLRVQQSVTNAKCISFRKIITPPPVFFPPNNFLWRFTNLLKPSTRKALVVIYAM
jgi:hypothetical protein